MTLQLPGQYKSVVTIDDGKQTHGINLDTRASPGMGKRTLDALYLKLGQTEINGEKVNEWVVLFNFWMEAA